MMGLMFDKVLDALAHCGQGSTIWQAGHCCRIDRPRLVAIDEGSSHLTGCKSILLGLILAEIHV